MGVAVQSGHGCCEARQREHALIMLCNVQLLRERMTLPGTCIPLIAVLSNMH